MAGAQPDGGAAANFVKLPAREETMRHTSRLLTAGSLALLLALAACHKDRDKEDNRRVDGPAERAGKELDQATEKAAVHLEKAREDFQQAARETGRELDQAAEKAGENLNKAAEVVGEKLERAGEKVQASAAAARQEDEAKNKSK
jgi:hypothetical protein